MTAATSATANRRARLSRVLPHVAIPVVIAITVLAMSGDGYLTHLATAAAIAYILTASFNLVFGYGGIFSLASVALYGAGAYASVYAENAWGWSFWIAIPFGVVVAAVLGGAIAWPTARLRSIFIAIVTLAFAVTLIEVFTKWTDVTGGSAGIYSITPPEFFGIRLVGGTVEYLILCAIVAWLVADLMLRTGRSAVGRKLAALRETPGVLAAVGVDAAKLRLLTFIVSSALAGLAGGLYAHFQLTIAPEAFGFGRLIELLLATVVGGAGTFIGPVVGVVVLMGLDEVGIVLGGLQPFIYGAAVILLMTFGRKGVAGWILALWAMLTKRRTAGVDDGAADADADTPPSAGDLRFTEAIATVTDSNPVALSAQNVTVSFGGVHAVRDVSLELADGEILGLIGPNGAGKTTFMNAITGEVKPSSGVIELNGVSLADKSREEIRKLGLSRTFQVPALVPDLSLLENVMLGGEAHTRVGYFRQMANVPASRRSDELHRERAHAFLREVGIDQFADGIAESQPYGVQRLAEIARCLMLDPDVILLDEPGAGLTEPDLEDLSTVLQKLRDRGRSVIVIDHHVGFVANVSDRIAVMNQGELLTEGAPDVVISDPRVIEAYLGEVGAV